MLSLQMSEETTSNLNLAWNDGVLDGNASSPAVT
jgi:hypothetical protein